MKNLIIVIVFLLSCSVISAQKIKMKGGTVFVDKEAFLKYEGDAFYTFDGVRLFSVKRVVTEKNGFGSSNQIQSRPRTQNATAQDLVQNNGNSSGGRVMFRLVKFSMFDLEFETSMSTKKVIRGFYSNNLVNEKGIIDEMKARKFARKAHKNISGTRVKI